MGRAVRPAADSFVKKYLPQLLITLGIAEGVSVSLPAERDSIGLLLGEMLQRDGDAKAAADIVEQVSPSTVAAVSLAELYAELCRWDEVVDLTNDVANEDEAATFLLIQRGIALRQMSHYEAARSAFRAALAPRSRPAELRRLALVERGQTYLAEGKKAMARKDFERVLAEDASYPGLQEHLAGGRLLSRAPECPQLRRAGLHSRGDPGRARYTGRGRCLVRRKSAGLPKVVNSCQRWQTVKPQVSWHARGMRAGQRSEWFALTPRVSSVRSRPGPLATAGHAPAVLGAGGLTSPLVRKQPARGALRGLAETWCVSRRRAPQGPAQLTWPRAQFRSR
jgi:tetratricopeptide (TPR) repeat protein